MSMMELSQILGNVGDFVGAIAVVVSLIYLALQVRDNSRLIRENTKAQQMAAEISSNDGNRDLYLAMIKDPELLGLLVKGMRGDRLTEVDGQRFAVWVRMIFESHMTYFAQTERGLSGRLVWEYWSRYFDRFCSLPGVVPIWQHIRGDFDEPFRGYIDAKGKPG